MSRTRSFVLAALLIAVIVVGSGMAVVYLLRQNDSVSRLLWGGNVAVIAPPGERSTGEGCTGRMEVMPSLAGVVAQVRPSTVYIAVREVPPKSFLDPFPREQEGVGSGIIINADGHILTNYHVVRDAQALVVVLTDGRQFTATAVGGDPATDLAVIKIPVNDLPAVKFADTSSVRIGDWVVAIGNALGLPGGPTVTVGVISALHRTIADNSSGRVLEDLIQTDAAINPGNSGGPLVNTGGEVVGINTAVATSPLGGQAAGIGFAISGEAFLPVMADLVRYGRVPRAYLGIVGVPLTPAPVARTGVLVQRGVLVLDVVPGSPAAKAGIKQHDTIIQIGNRRVTGMNDVWRFLREASVGQLIAIRVQRGSDVRTLNVELTEVRKPGSN